MPEQKDQQDQPPINPQLKMAKIRDGKQFKALLNREILHSRNPERRRELLAMTFLGAPSREYFEPLISEEDWNKAVDTLDRFFRILAETFINSAHLYNATKHGLAVNADPMTIELGDETDGVLLRSQGQSISYLETVRKGKNREEWQETTEWIDVERSIVLCYVACVLIDWLWRIARKRYLGANDASIKFKMLTWLDMNDLTGKKEEPINGIVVSRMSQPVQDV